MAIFGNQSTKYYDVWCLCPDTDQSAVTSLPSPKGPAPAIRHYYETYAVKHTYTGQLRQHQKARQYPGNERKAKTSYVNAYEKEFGATGPPAFEDTCSR